MKLAVLTTLVASTVGHICTLTPIQRGGVTGAQTPAADVCAQGAGPCGSVPAGAPTAAYFTGEHHGVHILKNLDHFNKTDPGSFAVYLWDAAGTSTRLNEIQDTPQPSMTVYDLQFVVPHVPMGNYTLQAVYTTNSPVHPTFYQCSDVTILN